ncbi:MAG TPA: PQQ-dependent sugar dehydrogenase [Polyangiaceae bacterium]|nr:PQQ-dependent sugar dehydrogenase [Polyangiaceae bacterium]
MSLFRWLALGGALFFLIFPRAARAAVIDTANFSEAPWISLTGTVTGMAWAPDGSKRLFVIDKGGVVQIVKWGTPPTPVTFATIAPIYTAIECGLVGLTFDPNFQINHFVYFFVTVSASEQQIIRYTAAGDVGIDKTVIVSGLPTVGANHDGGSIGFGPDGKLYWGIGDNGNGSGVNADLSSLAAKIGRANADGSIPNDNPFFDGAGPNNDYIWARGMRNPYTLTFQPATGALWVNVVGTSYEQVFLVRRGDHAGYNAYENNQPNGFIPPVIKYRTNGTDVLNVSAAARASNIVTFTTALAHGFRQGERIDVAGVTDATFDGAFYVASVLSTTTFTAAQSGPNAGSTGGTATTLNQGGCITGGSFYDGTQFGPAYRGNFFYGDYNSARLMRAVLGPGNTVVSVDYWGTSIANITDTSVGPDGALYYMGIAGAIYRTTFNTSVQALVVSATHLWMAEAGQTSVNVSLAIAPAVDVTVNVARTAGDADVNIGAGAMLTFTPATWSVPQAVTITSADDLDTVADAATITASSGGLASEDIFVNVVDDDANNFIISRAALSISEGGSDTFLVGLVKAPPATVTTTVARTGGDVDINVTGGATLTFDAANFGVLQTVTVSAAEDADSADDSATISVTAAGIAARTVAVTATDNEVEAPVITSLPITTAVVNAAYHYTVVATGRPAPALTLTAAPPGMAIGTSSGVVTWTPSAQGSFPVTVVAANGILPDATQSFAVAVLPDAAPTCALTRPSPGETVSGKTAEFFGDGFDDVGTTKAEFFVDGVLGDTDSNTQGHYHFRRAHNLWDTTLLTNGAHRAKMVISDTAGQTCEKEVDVTVANLIDGGASDDAHPDGSGGAVDADGGDREAATDAEGGARDAADEATADASRDAGGAPDTSRPDGASTDAATADAGGGASNDAGPDALDAGGQTPEDEAAGSGCGCKVAGRSERARSSSTIIFAFSVLVLGARRRRRIVLKDRSTSRSGTSPR